MSTEPELTIITAAEAKACKLWPLTTPYNTYTRRTELDKEVARLKSQGITVALVDRGRGTAEIWRGGVRWTPHNEAELWLEWEKKRRALS